MFAQRILTAVILAIAIIALPMELSAQNYPEWKFSGLAFGDYFYNISRDTGIASLKNVAYGGAKDLQGFQFRRIYATSDVALSHDFSTRFRLEADQDANASNGKIGVFVKDAFLRWKGIYPRAEILLGIIPTPAFEVSENAWGYRPLEKTIMDLRGIVSSRDIGIALKGSFDSAGTIGYWLQFGNGSGNKPETDKYKRYYGQLYFKPLSNLQVSLYGDLKAQSSITYRAPENPDPLYLNSDVVTTAAFIGYNDKQTLSLGVEAYMQFSTNGAVGGTTVNPTYSDRTGMGATAFASYRVTPDLGAVARFDYMDPNADSKSKGDTRMLGLAGVDFIVGPNVSLMPNVVVESFESAPNGRDITPSVTARLTFSYQVK